MKRAWRGRAARSLSVLLFATAAASCASVTRGVPGAEREGATLRVENQARLDVNVYALRAGQRIRLGTVNAHSTSTLRVPATLVGSGMGVQFIADFIGSDRAPVSEEVVIWPGEEVRLTIPST